VRKENQNISQKISVSKTG